MATIGVDHRSRGAGALESLEIFLFFSGFGKLVGENVKL